MINHYGFNKSRPALSFIPPTTVIGALSYPLNKLLRGPECYGEYSGAEVYRGIFKSINVKQPFFSVYHDLSKVLFMYRGEAKFDAVAVGKLYKSLQEPIEVILIINGDLAEKLLGKNWKALLRIACLSITRLGARESIVTPLEIKEGTPELIQERIVRTSFSFPSYPVRSISGSYIAGDVVDWRLINIGPYVGKKTVGYITPLSIHSTSYNGVEVEIVEGHYAYRCGKEVIIPWS